MKKRITAFFLSVCMIMSMFSQYIPGVSAKEIDPWENPEAYVGSVATFNTTNGEDSLSSFHIIGDPASYDYDVCWSDDAYWLYNESGEEGKDELPVDDMKMVITDCYTHEVCIEEDAVRFVWYKVEAMEGYELPEKMADKPYVLYMTADDIEYGIPASLNFDLIEETADTSPMEPEEIAGDGENTQEQDSDEIEGTVPDGKIDPWEEPGAYVGSIATFNTDELVDFHVFGNPESYDYNLCWEDDTYWLYNSEMTDELPVNDMKMLITGYYDHEVPVSEEDTIRFIWYQVEAVEDYELPEKMADKEYVLYMTTDDYELAMPASLLFDLIDKPQEPVDDGKPELGEEYTIEEVGLKGYFSEDVVKFYQQPLGTAITADLNTAELPDFIDVAWMVTDTRFSKPEVWYVIKVDENWSDIADWPICYVPISHVTLVPAEVTEFYEKLLGAETVDEYEELMENADSELLEQLTEKHFAALQDRYNTMVTNETRTEVGTTVIGDVSVPVTVTGLIPEGATVSVEPVSNATVIDGGFDIENEDEIVLALDIKVLDENGEEWQPKEGRQITVEIGMAELGYEDGKIFRLHHKHEDEIDVFEVFVVMDGKLTVRTNGFSLYVISDYKNFDPKSPGSSAATWLANSGNQQNPTTVTLTVGEPVVYYARPDRTSNLGTWQVTDKEGAIFYEVFANSTTAGHDGYYAPWIRVVPLKETSDDTELILRFIYRVNNTEYTEYYKLNIVQPTPDPDKDFDGFKLYIKDEVDEAGVIRAVLTDDEGKITDLGSESQFSWERSDGAYIVPNAYKNDGSSIDICLDHGGLIQRRIDSLEYITYTVTVTLPNGIQKTAGYTVYYQSEILNASFESPKAKERDYTFFMNGWPGLYWKTTSPGTGGNLTKDVEYANYPAGGNRFNNNVSFYPHAPADGQQIAELNAEEFGALYQDIITAPNEAVDWKFYHAKRNTDRNGEAMYLIMGPTKQAQELTKYDDLDDLIDYVLARNTDGESNETILRRGEAVTCTYTDGAEYTLWYHNAEVDKTPETAWDFLKGEYVPKDGQYRTRLFFVTDTNSSNKDSNYGNLIDSSTAGQYKRYLIEYYEEQYVEVNNSNVMEYTHMAEYDEGYTLLENGEKVYDEVLIYSTVLLKNFDHFEKVENDLLASVYINGENYPYNIRYSDGKPGLFIEKYSSTADKAIHYDEDEPVANRNDYEEYDIVMQVFFRDTVVAVQKWVEFPKIPETNKEALTAIQKQKLIDGLMEENDGKGYQAVYDLYCNTDDDLLDNNTISITKNDPSGWYTGYIPIGDNPNKDHDFILTEKSVPPLPGLELENVVFEYYQFHKGERTLAKMVEYDKNVTIKEVVNGEQVNYELVTKDGNVTIKEPLTNGQMSETKQPTAAGEGVDCEGIVLKVGQNNLRVAEIKVTNVYKEKEVTINYKAVGNGSVKLQTEGANLREEVSETFLYYSGNPKGVNAVPDSGYTFAGWYLDEDCTQPVGENHGYVNKTGEFKPNKNLTISDEVLEVTYYAKFSIGSLQIIRENAEPGQVFVYEITDENGNLKMYATVVVGENRMGSTEIVNVSFGTDEKEGLNYTVTQLNNWSWRHEGETISITERHKVTEGLHGATNMTTVFRFSDEQENDSWLNGNSTVRKNVYGGTN